MRDFECPLATELVVSKGVFLALVFLDLDVVIVFEGARSSGLKSSLSLVSTNVN